MKGKKQWLAYSIILIIPLFLTPFSSSLPDGLEWVAEHLGFDHAESANSFLIPPLSDYTFPGITHDGLSVFLAGILGAFLVFILGCGAAYYMRRSSSK
jgi:cobalt/nickel transport protein